MPLLPFFALFKPSWRLVTQAQNAAEATSSSSRQESIATATRTAPSPTWASIDVFGALQRFCETCGAQEEAVVQKPSPAPGRRFSSPPTDGGGGGAAELSTAELTAQVRRILLLRHDSMKSAMRSEAAAVEEEEGLPRRHSPVQARFMEVLQFVLTAHRTAIHFLRRRAAEVNATEEGAEGEAVMASSNCVLAEAASVISELSYARAASHQRGRRSDSSSPQCPQHSSSISAAESLTQVLSTNLYTISTLLEAFDDGESVASSSSGRRAALTALSDVVFPPLFYLITQTLDLAAAALPYATPPPCCRPSRTPSMLCVLQQEGSHVLSCLLRINDVPQHNSHHLHCDAEAACASSSATPGCRWVVTHHVLRRLRPLLFTALPHHRHQHNLISNNRTSQTETAFFGAACDRTDTEIVTWVAKQLHRYAAAEREQLHPGDGLFETDNACALHAHALSLQPSHSPTMSPSRAYESLEAACLTEVLRLLLQRFIAAARSSTCVESASTAVADTETRPSTLGTTASFAHEERYGTVSSVFLAEYANALAPAAARLQSSDVWDSLPSSLRGTVEELQTQLRRFGVDV